MSARAPFSIHRILSSLPKTDHACFTMEPLHRPAPMLSSAHVTPPVFPPGTELCQCQCLTTCWSLCLVYFPSYSQPQVQEYILDRIHFESVQVFPDPYPPPAPVERWYRPGNQTLLLGCGPAASLFKLGPGHLSCHRHVCGRHPLHAVIPLPSGRSPLYMPSLPCILSDTGLA